MLFGKCEKGLVSVFLIIIVSGIFMFNAILIDLIRVKLAEYESENAVKTALRSSFSAFDNRLLNYGLFGQSGSNTDRKNILADVLQQNIAPAYEDTHLDFLGVQVEKDSISYKSVYTLANHVLFRRQILELTKYQAPIEFTRNLWNKFSDTVPQMEAAQQFTVRADKLDTLINQRDKKLNSAWNHFETISNLVTGFHTEYANALGGEISEKQLRSLKQKASRDFRLLNEERSGLDKQLQGAKQIDEEIQKEIQQSTQTTSAGTNTTNPKQGESVFQHVTVYGTSFFVRYQTEGAQLTSYFGSFTNLLLQQNNSQLSIDELRHANDTYLEKTKQLYSTKLSEESKRKEEAETVRSKQNEQKQKAQSTINKVNKLDQFGCSGNEILQFVQLNGNEGWYAKYLEHNAVDFSNAEPSEIVNDPVIDAEQSAKQSLSLLSQLSNISEKARDEIYINEYALTNFNYRTYKLDSVRDKAFHLSEPGNHALQGQEVEYILYGFPSCRANMAAAYSELFAARLAVRTTEALMDPKITASGSVGSPLLVFLTALATGAEKAYSDMTLLLKGDEVELMDKLQAVKLTYKDYLRLFLLLHSDDMKMMARMQALISLNTGEDLMKKTVYAEGKAAMSIKLWFIPGIMKALGYAGALDGEVEGNRYRISRSAVLSY